MKVNIETRGLWMEEWRASGFNWKLCTRTHEMVSLKMQIVRVFAFFFSDMVEI